MSAKTAMTMGSLSMTVERQTLPVDQGFPDDDRA